MCTSSSAAGPAFPPGDGSEPVVLDEMLVERDLIEMPPRLGAGVGLGLWLWPVPRRVRQQRRRGNGGDVCINISFPRIRIRVIPRSPPSWGFDGTRAAAADPASRGSRVPDLPAGAVLHRRRPFPRCGGTDFHLWTGASPACPIRSSGHFSSCVVDGGPGPVTGIAVSGFARDARRVLRRPIAPAGDACVHRPSPSRRRCFVNAVSRHHDSATRVGSGCARRSTSIPVSAIARLPTVVALTTYLRRSRPAHGWSHIPPNAPRSAGSTRVVHLLGALSD